MPKNYFNLGLDVLIILVFLLFTSAYYNNDPNAQSLKNYQILLVGK